MLTENFHETSNDDLSTANLHSNPEFSRIAASLTTGQPFVVEYYYKAKWGHAEEFLKLFKKNHYPLLKKQVELGRMLKVWVDQPRYHTTEDGRWDYRVTIVFKNATLADEPFDEDSLKKQLFPDQETYANEEQRRFEILDAHLGSAGEDGRRGEIERSSAESQRLDRQRPRSKPAANDKRPTIASQFAILSPIREHIRLPNT